MLKSLLLHKLLPLSDVSYNNFLTPPSKDSKERKNHGPQLNR